MAEFTIDVENGKSAYEVAVENGFTGTAEEWQATLIGNGVASGVVDYQVGDSGTVIPTGEWSSSVLSVPQGQYLWTRIVTNYTDGTSIVSYSVARQGIDGLAQNNTISIGTVESGTTSSATMTGNSPNQVLNLVLQKGDTGATGQTGATGSPGKDGITPTLYRHNIRIASSTNGLFSCRFNIINQSSVAFANASDIHQALIGTILATGMYPIQSDVSWPDGTGVIIAISTNTSSFSIEFLPPNYTSTGTRGINISDIASTQDIVEQL